MTERAKRNPLNETKPESFVAGMIELSLQAFLPAAFVVVPVTYALKRDAKAAVARVGIGSHFRKLLDNLESCSKLGMLKEEVPDDPQQCLMHKLADKAGTEVLVIRMGVLADTRWLADMAAALKACRDAGLAEWRIRAVLYQPLHDAEPRRATPWIAP